MKATRKSVKSESEKQVSLKLRERKNMALALLGEAALPNFLRSSKTEFPNPPLILTDPPAKPPQIAQSEILDYLTSEHRLQIALADRNQRRACLVMKLLQVCRVAPGDLTAKLDANWNLVALDPCASCDGQETITTKLEA